MAYVRHMPTTDLLSTAEVAERAGVSIRTVLRWVDAGQLTPAVTAPGPTGARMFDQRDVALFLAAKRPA